MAALGKEVPAAHEQLWCLPSLFSRGAVPGRARTSKLCSLYCWRLVQQCTCLMVFAEMTNTELLPSMRWQPLGGSVDLTKGGCD